jgi:radical SAM superfamily enzyme YgiQ (UPF0313 family)
MYRHVLCVYPYNSELKHLKFIPPLGLEIIASIIENHCSEIEIVDLRHETRPLSQFIRKETDLICFSVNWKRDIPFVIETIRSIPPDIKTIVGGRHATECPEEWFEKCPNIDILLRGEGEQIIADLMNGIDQRNIPGISYWNGKGVTHNPNPVNHEVHYWKSPNRKLRKYQYVIDFKNVSTGVTFDLISGSRGCPFHCKFCSFNKNPWGVRLKWSPRPIDAVIDELESMEAKVVGFIDDTFTHDPDRVERICDEIISRGIKKVILINSRLEIAKRPDVLKKMHKAGFAVLMTGIESAQDKTLRSMQKGFTTKQVEKYVRVLSKSGMHLHAYFIVGNINETREEMLEILPFARRIGVDTIALSALKTTLYDDIQELVSRTPGYHINYKGYVYSDELSKKDINKIRKQIKKGFFTPAHIIRTIWKFNCSRGFLFNMIMNYLLNALRARIAA